MSSQSTGTSMIKPVASSVSVSSSINSANNPIDDGSTDINALQAYSCRSIMDYEKIQLVGKGTYGTVCMFLIWIYSNPVSLKLQMNYILDKAKDRKTGEIVALKKLRMSKETEGVWVHILYIPGLMTILFILVTSSFHSNFSVSNYLDSWN